VIEVRARFVVAGLAGFFAIATASGLPPLSNQPLLGVDSTRAAMPVAAVARVQRQWAKELRLPVEFVVEKNGLNMAFVLVPPGKLASASSS